MNKTINKITNTKISNEMKKLLSIFIFCLGCFGIIGAQNIWNPINISGHFLGVSRDGSIFTHQGTGGLARSQDEGETWQIVLGQQTGYDSFFNDNCFYVNNEGRIFVFNDNRVAFSYSDDNGDTWQHSSQMASCAMVNTGGVYACNNDTIVVWSYDGEIYFSVDGGNTWDYTILEFMDEDLNVGDVIVSEAGDVYVSLWQYSGYQSGIYHSTLSDMQNWELAAFDGDAVFRMEFDPEGNIIANCFWTGPGFAHEPGFYLIGASSFALADNGIVYKRNVTMNNTAVLAYSLDHGEHFYNTVQDLPLSEPLPGSEDGILTKGFDNHLYFFGNGQFWKSIPDANDIPSAFSFPSEWYYEIEWENGSVTYQHLECVGDTTIGNERPKIIVRSNTHYDRDGETEVTREYVYEENNIVYWWNKDLQEFTTLYDLAAEVGDEWEIKVGTESLTMHVDAVESLDYEGKAYRMLRVSDADELFSGNIVCGIGHMTSFFPERLMNRGRDFRVEGLRCYWVEDALLYHNGDEDCDAVYSELHGVEENGPSTPSIGSGTPGTLSVYPNPANNVLFVEKCHGASLQAPTYRITNLMGQILQQGDLNAETQRINIESLPEGMYFISVGDETLKFVKR